MDNWGPAPLDKIFEPGDSEKKTLSGGKMIIKMNQNKKRSKTPPVLKRPSNSSISFQSSSIVKKHKIIGLRSQNRINHILKRTENSFNTKTSIIDRDKSSFELSINKSLNSGGINKTKQDKVMNMIQKIIVKIDEEESESLSGKFKFRNKELGNCFVILSDDKEKLMGVFSNEDYNERLAYNFLEEIEMILVSYQR